MFLLRSAFWLTLAFLFIGPKDVDFAASASALQAQAMAAGQQLVVDQISQGGCTNLTCAGSQALIAAAIASSDPSAASPMQGSPAGNMVPLPRPRPDITG